MADWLFAEGFPATILPAGANWNGVLTNFDEHNIDTSQKAPDGCMTDPNRWPREYRDVPAWWHGDYKDVPYQHTRYFYNKVADIIAAWR